jgi:hypothetical protein
VLNVALKHAPRRLGGVLFDMLCSFYRARLFSNPIWLAAVSDASLRRCIHQRDDRVWWCPDLLQAFAIMVAPRRVASKGGLVCRVGPTRHYIELKSSAYHLDQDKQGRWCARWQKQDQLQLLRDGIGDELLDHIARKASYICLDCLYEFMRSRHHLRGPILLVTAAQISKPRAATIQPLVPQPSPSHPLAPAAAGISHPGNDAVDARWAVEGLAVHQWEIDADQRGWCSMHECCASSTCMS